MNEGNQLKLSQKYSNNILERWNKMTGVRHQLSRTDCLRCTWSVSCIWGKKKQGTDKSKKSCGHLLKGLTCMHTCTRNYPGDSSCSCGQEERKFKNIIYKLATQSLCKKWISKRKVTFPSFLWEYCVIWNAVF